MSVLNEIFELLEDFHKVAQLAGVSLTPGAISFEVLPAPHKPPFAIDELINIFLMHVNQIAIK